MPHNDLAIQFEDVFKRLLARENVDLYAEDMSLMFEGMAMSLLAATPGREGCYFDGVEGLASTIRSPRQVEFTGEMWVGRDRSQWLEPFRATVTDKRSTKQGIWIMLCIGNDRAEGELSSLFVQSKGHDHAIKPHPKLDSFNHGVDIYGTDEKRDRDC